MVRKSKSAQDMIDEEDDESESSEEDEVESDDEEEEEKPVKNKKDLPPVPGQQVVEVPIDLTLINNKINYIISILDKK